MIIPADYPPAMTKTKTIPITEPVRAALASAEIGADFVRLTGQLARDAYVATNRVIEALGGKWDRKRACHVFGGDPGPRIAGALGGGAAAAPAVVDRKATYQAFYTPAALAERLCREAGLRPGMRVLEPSAGGGALADAARAICGTGPLCVEIRPEAAAELRARGHEVAEADFLAAPVAGPVDAVVMNPPFAGGQDIAHVERALGWLRPGGTLAAITAPGWTFRADRRHAAFRGRVEELGGRWEKLPPGTFRESGTEVSAVLLVLEAPAAAEGRPEAPVG